MSRYLPFSPNNVQNYHWQRFTDYRHASQKPLLRTNLAEAVKVAAYAPLVFVKTPHGMQLHILTSLTPNNNTYIDTEKRWTKEYVPVALRTEPFHLLPHPQQADSYIVCVDIQSPWLIPSAEAPFGSCTFYDEDNHTPSKPVQEVITFMQDHSKHQHRTDQASKVLDEAGLLTPLRIKDQKHGDLYTLDEKALNQLEDSTYITLRPSGALALAYIQMISTQHIPALRNTPQPPEKVDLDSLFGDDDFLKF